MRRLEPPAVDPESEIRTLAAGVKLSTRDQLKTLVTEVRLRHSCGEGSLPFGRKPQGAWLLHARGSCIRGACGPSGWVNLSAFPPLRARLQLEARNDALQGELELLDARAKALLPRVGDKLHIFEKVGAVVGALLASWPSPRPNRSCCGCALAPTHPCTLFCPPLQLRGECMAFAEETEE
jgi:hypothetical protein